MEEKKVQALVADFPWLLGTNYETVPELPKKGQEFVLDGDSRADLVLKERITNRPVVVEFKARPFYRENIGQLLEYRARMLADFQTEEATLFKIFGNQIVSPIMILVVPKCDESARIACNMSGISVYEYEHELAKWVVPERRLTLEEFALQLEKNDLPLSDTRADSIRKIETDIFSLLSSLNAGNGYFKHRGSREEYYGPMTACFLNKWLFPQEAVSIGIYEDILHGKYDTISLDYFSRERDLLIPLQSELRKIGKAAKITEDKEYNELYLSFEIKKKLFLKDVKRELRPFVKAYLRTFRKAEP